MGQTARIARLEEKAGLGRGRFYFIVFGRTLEERDALVETSRERGDIRRGDLVERVPWTLDSEPPPPRWIVAKSRFTADEDAMMGDLCERRIAAIHAEMERRGAIDRGESASNDLTGLHDHELHVEALRSIPEELIEIDRWPL